ncbi:hypothetical protein GCM10010466_32570 [Planomonospora alba]|uniref:DUF11 domain-containing protein n=1 Tax=Planomonospora alba TaxID=161354 RepID=A0ABP6N7I3_9ACTN
MSHPLARLGAAALAAVLGGALLTQSPAAAATPAAPMLPAAPATAAAAKPKFTAVVYFDKYARRGGTITYKVRVANKGGYDGQAYGLLGGRFPAGTHRIKVVAKPRSVSCKVKGRDLSCWVASLDNGDTTSVTLRVSLKRSARGTYAPRFGIAYTADRRTDRGKLFDTIRFKKIKGTRIL